MNKILDVLEDIKQNITDNQYKIIMEALMEINNKNKLPLSNNNPKLNKIIYLFNWLDTKLLITDLQHHCSKRMDLHKYVITNCFDCRYYENIDTVKQFLKIILRILQKSKRIVMNISLSNIEINTNYIILLLKDDNIIYHIIYI